MNTFYIVRHGETENNAAGRLSGWIDTPLTPNGLVPTRTVVEKLREIPIHHIVSSDSGRAFITAYTIARARGFEDVIVRTSGLREVNYGDAGNMKAEDAYAAYPGLDSDTHYTPPNGESLSTMQARVLQALNYLDTQYVDEHILLVAHSGVMAAINSSFTGQDFGSHNITEAYPHDFVARLTIDAGKVTSFDTL